MSSHPPISQISDPVRLRLVQAPAGTRITHPRCHIIFDGNPLNLSQPKKRALVAGLARAMPKLYGLVEIDPRTGVPKDPEMRRDWLLYLREARRPLEDGTSAKDAPLEAPAEPEPPPPPAPAAASETSTQPPDLEVEPEPPPPPAPAAPPAQHTTEGQADFAARWGQQQKAVQQTKPPPVPAPAAVPQPANPDPPVRPMSKHERKLQHKQAAKAAQQARGSAP